MTIAAIRRSIRDIEAATRGTFFGRLMAMSDDQVAAYHRYRAESREWYARHPNAYARFLDGEITPPAPPPGLLPPPAILRVGDDAAEGWRRMIERA